MLRTIINMKKYVDKHFAESMTARPHFLFYAICTIIVPLFKQLSMPFNCLTRI